MTAVRAEGVLQENQLDRKPESHKKKIQKYNIMEYDNKTEGSNTPTPKYAPNDLTEGDCPPSKITIKWPETDHSPQEATSKDNGGDSTSPSTRDFWKFHMRGYDDDGETDWWFASTAVPLLAATIAPLANVLSIAALVTSWRLNLEDDNGNLVQELLGKSYADPPWCYWLNVVSLICGFIGNVFLLFNFTGRIRYIVALPMTIILWYMATAILIGITSSIHIYVPPHAPTQTYSQGFWYAVIAAILYFICSMLLMLNMLGYFFGHYPQRFNLTEHQRTLIIQTMLFFIWLAGGGGMFARIESTTGRDPQEWGFVDGLYFCDVTILTVGFGDLYLRDDLARGLVFPYSVGGIVMLGLVISSISKFARQMSEENFVRKHAEKERSRALGRTVTDSYELVRRETELSLQYSHTTRRHHLHISAPFNAIPHLRPSGIVSTNSVESERRSSSIRRRRHSIVPVINKRTTIREVIKRRHPKILLLREEKDRFEEMRRIQNETVRFKKWWALTVSVCAFGILWLVGAVAFWQCEKTTQDMTYFQALYFCYVSLLTIGYGDLAPKSNAGRPVFVVWSLVAVPTMTLLISDMSLTIIESFKRSAFHFADFTILPKEGVWREWLERHPQVLNWLRRRREEHDRQKRLAEGMQYPSVNDPDMTDQQTQADEEALHPTLEQLEVEVTNDSNAGKNGGGGRGSSDATTAQGRDIGGSGSSIGPGDGVADRDHVEKASAATSERVLARRLTVAIRKIAADVHSDPDKKYSFEEWAELTRLIRFTGQPRKEALREEEEGLIEWDWIGENSPMMAMQSEPEFVLDRLCESLARYMRRVERKERKNSMMMMKNKKKEQKMSTTTAKSLNDEPIKEEDEDENEEDVEDEGVEEAEENEEQEEEIIKKTDEVVWRANGLN